jgi:hypothetical protein
LLRKRFVALIHFKFSGLEGKMPAPPAAGRARAADREMISRINSCHSMLEQKARLVPEAFCKKLSGSTSPFAERRILLTKSAMTAFNRNF